MNVSEKQKLLENVSAISATFHVDKRQEDFYVEYGEQLGGFPGIWKYCVRLGKYFTIAESEKKELDFEWPQAIDNFVNLIMEIEPVNEKQGVELAQKAISEAN